ncbi:MAG TPA: 1-acyl-sn-glycerol-3-phosphate acyltransferase [Vicinamibacteria bacterium]|nr:1-acyl-sn-glycerol-3-phosphate acyltransferase [Vicinamibacteria bacterium]
MLVLFRAVRSLVAVLLVGLYFFLASPILRLVVIPGAWLFPRQRFRLVSVFMKGMATGIFALLRLGGARVRRSGSLPTATPILVVANHQALLDIIQVALLAHPRVPAFVSRRRYARFVPLVSACIRLLGSPIVDPKRDVAGAVAAIRRGARELPHGMLIFPEGHRSRDGEIRAFRTAGIEAALAERRVPVYTVVNEGVWRVRRLADLLFRVHLIDAYSEVAGPFEPPAEDAGLPAFVHGLRETLVARLAELRSATAPPAA